MKQKNEIHSVKIEKTQSSSSVVGEVKTYSSGRVKGEIDTIHTSNFTANGRSYSLSQRNTKSPFHVGDDVIFLCRQNKSSGIYAITSFINHSSGIKAISSPVLRVAMIVGLLFFMLLLLSDAFDLGKIEFVIFASPLVLGTGYYIKNVFPYQTRAINFLNQLYGIQSKAEQKRILKDYDGIAYVGKASVTKGKATGSSAGQKRVSSMKAKTPIKKVARKTATSNPRSTVNASRVATSPKPTTRKPASPKRKTSTGSRFLDSQ